MRRCHRRGKSGRYGKTASGTNFSASRLSVSENTTPIKSPMVALYKRSKFTMGNEPVRHGKETGGTTLFFTNLYRPVTFIPRNRHYACRHIRDQFVHSGTGRFEGATNFLYEKSHSGCVDSCSQVACCTPGSVILSDQHEFPLYRLKCGMRNGYVGNSPTT